MMMNVSTYLGMALEAKYRGFPAILGELPHAGIKEAGLAPSQLHRKSRKIYKLTPRVRSGFQIGFYDCLNPMD